MATIPYAVECMVGIKKKCAKNTERNWKYSIAAGAYSLRSDRQSVCRKSRKVYECLCAGWNETSITNDTLKKRRNTDTKIGWQKEATKIIGKNGKYSRQISTNIRKNSIAYWVLNALDDWRSHFSDAMDDNTLNYICPNAMQSFGYGWN